MRQRLRISAYATLVLVGLGCSTTRVVDVILKLVGSIEVAPNAAILGVGKSVQLQAIPRDTSGNPLPEQPVTWSSSNTTIARVTNAGLVTAAATGIAFVVATSEGVSDTSLITATTVPVASVTLSPPTASVDVGQTVQLQAITRDADGVTLTGRAVAWSSSNAGIARVSTSGLVTAVAAGSATITGTSEGQSGASTITVTMVPVASVTVTPATTSVDSSKTVQLTAVVRDANGGTLIGRTVTWTSLTPGVATVSASGLVTGVKSGSANVYALSEGKSDTATITVVTPPPPPPPAAVASVTVTPASVSVETSRTVQLTAVLRDASGNTLTGRPITWTSLNPSVATVSASGLVTGLTVGNASVYALSEGKSDTSAITVVAPPPPPPGGSAVFVGSGDIGDCGRSGKEETAKLLDAIAGTVYTTGDNAYPDGTDADFANCYDASWGRHKARTMPSPGNHDYHTSGASGYYKYYGANAGPAGRGYYSFDLGEWHIISLNSNISMSSTSAQVTWLKADLAANPKKCTLAYWHHPRFSSGDHGNNSSTQPLYQALYDADADVILTGHDHSYERFAPQTATGVADPVRGIRQFVIGTGGRSFYGFGTIKPNSEVRNTGTWGVVKFTLYADRYDWEFVPVAGKTFTDTGTGMCH